MPYGAAFEGERIRKQDTRVEFGGNRTTAFEFVTSADMDAITDGQIELIGPRCRQRARRIRPAPGHLGRSRRPQNAARF